MDQGIGAAVEGMLGRLQTDWIARYPLHWPDRNMPLFGQRQFGPDKEHDFVPLAKARVVLAEPVGEGRAR